jgi:NAD(P)-dependent dehydrogenase (short-subunit alcohol dehydrogenase family)
VNAICPGPIATRMVQDIARQVSPNNPKGVEERYSATIPLRRYGTAEEVANLVLFLCSDLASNSTGAQYVVDGGRTATPVGVSQRGDQ